VVTHQRQAILTIPENLVRLRAAFKREMEKSPFVIDAIAVLPDHLHAIWTLPDSDSDYSVRWGRIKRYFSIGCVGVNADASASRQKKREKLIWQRRFWEHTIQNDEDWQRHMDYIHYNPVKHGYSQSAADWEASSFNRCVQKGWYSASWGKEEPLALKGLELE
jgi:putative transposase